MKHWWVRLGVLVGALSGCGEAPTGVTTAPIDYSETVHLLLVAGQSNAAGTDKANPPAGLPDASIPLWRNSYYDNSGSHTWDALDLDRTHGLTYSHEVATARAVQAAGYRVGVIKLTQGSTYMNRWVPGAKVGWAGSKFYAEISEAMAAAPAAFPGATDFVVHFIWDQGEAEARYFDEPTVRKWHQQYVLVRGGVEQAVGGPVHAHIVRTSSVIVGKTFPGVLEEQQALSADDPEHLHNTDDATVRKDGVHRAGAFQSLLGAQRIAPRVLADIEAF